MFLCRRASRDRETRARVQAHTSLHTLHPHFEPWKRDIKPQTTRGARWWQIKATSPLTPHLSIHDPPPSSLNAQPSCPNPQPNTAKGRAVVSAINPQPNTFNHNPHTPTPHFRTPQPQLWPSTLDVNPQTPHPKQERHQWSAGVQRQARQCDGGRG